MVDILAAIEQPVSQPHGKTDSQFHDSRLAQAEC